MISHNHCVIFVHIPKCAGQSVENLFLKDLGMSWSTRSPLLLRANPDRAVGPPRLGHLTATEYVDYNYLSADLWNQYNSFSLVRNPYKRAESLYRHFRLSGVISFERFINYQLPKMYETCWTWFVQPQVNYICAEDDSVLVKDLFKLEFLDENFANYLTSLGVRENQLQHFNRSKDLSGFSLLRKRFIMLSEGVYDASLRVDRNIQWNAKMQRNFLKIYKKDFEVLGYSTDYI